MNTAEFIRHQFDSCSYAELNMCIEARIEWIREELKFLHDPQTTCYGHIRASVRLSILTQKNEIHRIWKMRHIMKRTGLRNWNTEYVREFLKEEI